MFTLKLEPAEHFKPRYWLHLEAQNGCERGACLARNPRLNRLRQVSQGKAWLRLTDVRHKGMLTKREIPEGFAESR